MRGLYFITFTCCQWLPLFELIQAYDEVYKQFDLLRSEGHFVAGYVIMPNHIHVLIAFNKKEKRINQRIGTMKRFLAYAMVSRLEKAGQTNILHLLETTVNNSDKKKGKLHRVFEPSFDCKVCFTIKMTMQKLHYIHSNPCRGKWQLVADPIEYRYSSARFYETGEPGLYPVTHYMMLNDMDL